MNRSKQIVEEKVLDMVISKSLSHFTEYQFSYLSEKDRPNYNISNIKACKKFVRVTVE